MDSEAKITTENYELFRWDAYHYSLIFDQSIDERQTKMLHHLADLIRAEATLNVKNITISFAEILITLSAESNLSLNSVKEILSKKITKSVFKPDIKYTLWRIPVCYDVSFGLDLAELTKSKNLSLDTLIDIHSSAHYELLFYGFLPGFMYLSGLDPQLFTPRKSTPRHRVLPGSVGIAGKQTGIYPIASPGGWNIIGRCPIPIWNPNRLNPLFIRPGDRLKFDPISIETFSELVAIDFDTYDFEKLKI